MLSFSISICRLCDLTADVISGEYHRLVKELELEREVWYTQYLRMSPQQIKYLADLVSSDASKVDTNWRKAISVEERLAVSLRY